MRPDPADRLRRGRRPGPEAARRRANATAIGSMRSSGDRSATGSDESAVRRSLASTSAPSDDRGRSIEPTSATPARPPGWRRSPRRPLCLDRQILPADAVDRTAVLAEEPRRRPAPRSTVSASSLGGNHRHVDPRRSRRRVAIGRRRDRARSRSAMRRSGLFAIEADDESGLAERIRELERHGRERRPASHRRAGPAMVAASSQRSAASPRDWRSSPTVSSRSANRSIGVASRAGTTRSDGRIDPRPSTRSPPNRAGVRLPRPGQPFAGMGRELSASLARGAPGAGLGERLSPRSARSARSGGTASCPATFADHRVPILGQVAVGSLVTDVLRGLGVAPDAAIGYSLGESAALVALAGLDRPRRDAAPAAVVAAVPTELAGPCDAARRVWGIPPSEPVDWVAGIVPRSAEAVRAAIAGPRAGFTS